MLRKLKAFMLCGFIVMVMAVPSVHADVKEGWYYGLGAGAAIPTDGEWTSATNTGDFDYDTGYLFSGAVGYKFGMPRLEAEVLYQSNDYDRNNPDGLASRNPSGDINCLAFMANFYIDFTNDSSFTPFILAGIGAANVEADLTIAGV
ncbi:MAG: outer membrane beta-barrel protein, partial [Desulfobacteraceae bacterium]|nr:outer membrane beta-barrel protein [Desulfobacteraceae bacterium]